MIIRIAKDIIKRINERLKQQPKKEVKPSIPAPEDPTRKDK